MRSCRVYGLGALHAGVYGRWDALHPLAGTGSEALPASPAEGQ